MSLLKEWNGDFTSDNAEVGGISSLEKLKENALFLRSEVKVRVSLCYKIVIRQLRWVAHTKCGCMKGRGGDDGGRRAFSLSAPKLSCNSYWV